ncbi:MAG: nucleotidyltransferase domain-containing protein [Planctomycetes bacterium]|nr:nucleotidyltransferase domain-containing protein [Planctomycetota bacterium]MBU4398183.1 nucleotidyltransferase domain-containing protein [Planctomycetota bacterium]MCG2685322.1 nucleotidyltransferase domain-containing protein [Planctomycetales bacterium]
MKTRNANLSSRTPDSCVVELREMLQEVLGDDFVRLYHYGSRVEGGADPESDYDVLCVTRRPLSRRQKDEIMDRRMDIELSHAVLFDLHFRHGGQTNSASLLYSPFMDHVISEGIVV